MLNRELEMTLQQVLMEAKSKSYELVTVEQVLLALIDNPSAGVVLRSVCKNVTELKTELMQHISEETPKLGIGQIEPIPTHGFQNILQRAVFQVQSSGGQEVSGTSLLVSIFAEEDEDSHAVYLLKRQGVTRYKLIDYISHGSSEKSSTQSPNENGTGEEETSLSKFTTNLNEKAANGDIDPIIGRDSELERVQQILGRRRKNNPILVGEAGVGKTAIAEGLALNIVNGNVSKELINSVVYSVDIGDLVAGTKYRGDFEKRFKALLKELSSQENAIMFIDEIHTIIGAGAASGGNMDVGNMLKPLLSSGKLSCIGATTYQEYKTIFDKENALSRRFQKVEVVEPNVEDTTKILMGLKEHYELHHNVSYTTEAISTAVVLSKKYMNDRFLPDKAIDIMDEAGAIQKMFRETDETITVDKDMIEKVIAKIARIPEKSVSSDEVYSLKNLDRDLKMTVYGQDHAIEEIASEVRLARSGLGDETKPNGSFLFAGPTGVGKTELTQQLANSLGIKLLRFDMSEYQEKHSVARLVGSPPGYVGHDEGGLLTEEVMKNPHAVVLLDEIEKAHSDIYNLLLQVMDYGTLTDSTGKKADFRNVTLIMTTNAGVRTVIKQPMGFKIEEEGDPSANENAMEEINRTFSPEFRNRLDKVVWFNSLGKDVILNIVGKHITDLQMKLDAKSVVLKVSKSAKDWLAENGVDAAMGARPLGRVFKEKVTKAIANEVLFGDLTNGGVVKVSVKGGELSITTESSKEAEVV